MKLAILSLLILTFSHTVFGGFPLVKVVNIKGEYMDGKGEAYADHAKYELPSIKLSHTKMNVTFSKKKKNLLIHDQNTTLELGFDFSFMNVFKSFRFNEVNFNSLNTSLTMDAGLIELMVAPQKYFVRGINLSSDISDLEQDAREEVSILDGIINNTELSIKSIAFASTPSIIEVFEGTDFIFDKAIPMVLRHTKIDIKKGEFKLNTLVDSYLNLWARAYGQIRELPNQKVIEIELRSAKLGIFSIKKRILSFVRNMKLERVWVKSDKIYINYENEDALNLKNNL